MTDDPFLDTPELRAERKGENPRWHWCPRCGIRWETGTSGSHNCIAYIMNQRDDARDELSALRHRCEEAERTLALRDAMIANQARHCTEWSDNWKAAKARCKRLETALREIADPKNWGRWNEYGEAVEIGEGGRDWISDGPWQPREIAENALAPEA